jgi:hypothetical protein
MWVTQTYLGNVEADAKVFVYYFYCDYIESQNNFTKNLQEELEKLGDLFGGTVSLLMPNPRYEGRIEAEVREIRPLWEALYDRLPGMFLSTKPLSKVRAYDEWCFFVPFEDQSKSAVLDAVNKIRRLADEAITWNYQENAKVPEPGFTDRFLNAIEIKPGIGGFKLDVKKLFRR